MQNNVTELTEKLLRALDTNYNVTDMQTVIDIIVLLDKVAITKEVLEATRLGKHVNELRRNTSNDWLAKRAKELVKKWRNLVLPPLQQHSQEPTNATINNGQLKQQSIAHAPAPVVRDKLLNLPQDAHVHNQQEDSGGAVGAIVAGGGNRKRSAKEKKDTNSSGITSKRPRMNGGSELDLSDTSNSSFHDAVLARNDLRLARTSAAAPSITLINSDSNSSLPEVKTQLVQDPSISHHFLSTNQQHTPSIATIPMLTPPLTSPSSTTSIHPQHLTTSPGLPTTISTPTTPLTVQPVLQEQQQQQQQRRRGRRKGSSAHRSLLDEADASFTSKMARGANARVKTTQELVASLQGRGGVMVGVPSSVGAGSAGKVGGIGGSGGMKEDLVQKAAKLTERVSIIDQKLNTNANRYKNNGGSTTSSSTNKHHHHHHNRHNNINNNNNNNSLSNMGTSEANDDDIIVVDEDDFSMKQQRCGSSGRHRKRRDSAGTRGEGGGDGDNITIKHDESMGREVGIGIDGQSDAVPAPPRSLDTATALSLLPPIDRQSLNCTSPSPLDCSCRLTDNTNQITTTIITKKRSDFSVGTDDEDDDDQPENQQLLEPLPLYEWEADDGCSAADFLRKKYRLCDVDGDTVRRMHERYIPGVNCNTQSTKVIVNSDPSDNVVPDVYRDLRRKLEAYKPYSISETGLGISDGVKVEVDDKDRTTTTADAAATVETEQSEQVEYREYHEILDVPSYNGEMLRILPYVIID